MLSVQREAGLELESPGRKGWRECPVWERGGQWESPASAHEGPGLGKQVRRVSRAERNWVLVER